MSLSLSDKALSIAPSATLGLNAAVAVMKQQGVDVISLGAGEPDFPTPAHIRHAAFEAMEQGKTRYTDVSGIPELRQAIAAHIFHLKKLTYAANEIIVGSGAKQVLLHALQAILNPGDEVILPSPYWVSYTEMIKIASGVPVFISTEAENDFLPTPSQMAAAVTPRTKAMILNSPNNPTGAVWPRELLQAAVDLARKYDYYIISDEIYEDLCYDGYAHVSPAQLGDDAFRRTILVSGFSKAYAMTGWRVGYASAARPIIAAMTALQSHTTGNPNSIAQYAALAALTGPQDCVHEMVAAFARRRKLILECFARQGLKPGILPQGAFYLLLDIRPFIDRHCGDTVISDDAVFAEQLLQNAHVAIVPGTPFGAPGFARLSYAISEENIARAVERIGRFVRTLQ